MSLKTRLAKLEQLTKPKRAFEYQFNIDIIDDSGNIIRREIHQLPTIVGDETSEAEVDRLRTENPGKVIVRFSDSADLFV